MATERVQATDIHNNRVDCFYRDIPETCPICHTAILPQRITAVLGGWAGTGGSVLQVIFQCTKCQEIFIGTCDFFQSQTEQYYQLYRLAPKTAQEAKFSEEISNTSPTFIEIYNQALVAEAENLTHIAGFTTGHFFQRLNCNIESNRDREAFIQQVVKQS